MASKQYKILMLQKDRTQKNESYILLRSIFLPYIWSRLGSGGEVLKN